ncbi:MAG TPA: hypothetical protein VFA45_13535, partial [Actinomycetes bacterium]|nr:hypothetical protein [Actinomycetes bacterium]
MTAKLETALSRLRNADPAAATPLDAQGEDPHARAMLTEILHTSGDRAVAVPNRTRRRAHRLALAGAVVAALALSAVAGVVSMPWSHGRVSSAAYAVTKHADGTVGVTIHWNQLRHP